MEIVRGILKDRKDVYFRSSMHVHVGKQGGIAATKVKKFGFIGKSMEFFWNKMAPGNIMTFPNSVFWGSYINGKNDTPFYWDSKTQTVAFNTFMPAPLKLFGDEKYFAWMQSTIATAMSIVEVAEVRSNDFDWKNSPWPVLAHDPYSARNAQLLRKHLDYFWGNDYLGKRKMQRLMIEKGEFPQLLVSSDLYSKNDGRIFGWQDFDEQLRANTAFDSLGQMLRDKIQEEGIETLSDFSKKHLFSWRVLKHPGWKINQVLRRANNRLYVLFQNHTILILDTLSGNIIEVITNFQHNLFLLLQ